MNTDTNTDTCTGNIMEDLMSEEEFAKYNLEYVRVLKDTNLLTQKLLNDLVEAKRELKDQRYQIYKLEKELELFKQTAVGNVNRHDFSFYVLAAVGRIPTDSEWVKFTQNFVFDSRELNQKIYDWIDLHIK